MTTFYRVLMVLDGLLLIANLYVKNYWLAALLGFTMGVAAYIWRRTDE